MIKHFVTFFSPGTFLSESTCLEIDGWDVDKAVELARNIQERHCAVPYGFKFITYDQTEDNVHGKEIAKSNMYYLGGRVETYEMILIRNDPDEQILRFNMESNNIKRIVINMNSYITTQPFGDNDVLLEVDM